MISRHWKGIARKGESDNYVQHLRDEIFPKLKAMFGFIRASILQRDVEMGIEFLVTTEWESPDAIRAFAAADVEAAVVPEVVQAMMVEYDRRAVHYEVVEG